MNVCGQGFYAELAKIAMSWKLKQLIRAKEYSDEGQYLKKHKILAKLMKRDPEDWEVDSSGRYLGLTHLPTGFRIHAPRELVPPGVAHGGG